MRLLHLKRLRCPYCKNRIIIDTVLSWRSIGNSISTEDDIDLQYGVLRCACSQYPVIHNIVYLKNNEACKKSVQFLHNHDLNKATDVLFDFPRGISWIIKKIKPYGYIDSLLSRIGCSTEKIFLKNQWLIRIMGLYEKSTGWMHYLLTRDLSPTFQDSLLSIPLFSNGFMLDIGCGHGLYLQKAHKDFNQKTSVGVDDSFWNIFIASFFSADTFFICCDISIGIPLESNILDGIVLNDSYHCIKQRKSLNIELNRVLSPDGIIAINHVHLKNKLNTYEGYPLAQTDVATLHKRFYLQYIDEHTFHKNLIRTRKSVKFATKKIPTTIFSSLKSPAYIILLSKKSKIGYINPLSENIGLNLKKIQYQEDPWLKI